MEIEGFLRPKPKQIKGVGGQKYAPNAQSGANRATRSFDDKIAAENPVDSKTKSAGKHGGFHLEQQHFDTL
ncbi:hypothetical protein MACH10_00020 [Thalassospira tepidiphila]|uniref:hypothetical protein n=1 Tax=Thalassospira tepidiphila TaxID=393657 RepID=UPI0029207D9D|nr:hypothetical protein MACH10_00020 [Thalassospira tepidiphila]